LRILVLALLLILLLLIPSSTADPKPSEDHAQRNLKGNCLQGAGFSSSPRRRITDHSGIKFKCRECGEVLFWVRADGLVKEDIYPWNNMTKCKACGRKLLLEPDINQITIQAAS